MNRAFLYGDLLFESVRALNGKLCYAGLHFERLMWGATTLHFDTGNFSPKDFETACLDAMKRAGLTDARIRFVLHRDAGGFYTPEHDRVLFFAEAVPLDQPMRVIRELGFYTNIRKAYNPLAGIKSGNALLYVLAGIFKREQGWDDCLLLNEQGRVTEATSSNIFILKDQKLITPLLSEACVKGVMRDVIINRAGEMNLTVEEGQVTVEDLDAAEEIFLTNAIYKIMPVTRWKQEERSTALARMLYQLIE